MKYFIPAKAVLELPAADVKKLGAAVAETDDDLTEDFGALVDEHFAKAAKKAKG
jgi:hypothetical protein